MKSFNIFGKKVTYWTEGPLEKASLGIGLSDGGQQLGYTISKPLQPVCSTGEELTLPLQFGRVQKLDVPLLQST